MWKTTILHHPFLYISLSLRHDYDVKLNLISRFVEDINTRRRFSFSFLNFDVVFKNSTLREFVNIWQNEQSGAISDEVLGDVLVAVAVV